MRKMLEMMDTRNYTAKVVQFCTFALVAPHFPSSLSSGTSNLGLHMIPHLDFHPARRRPKSKRVARRRLISGMEQLESRQLLALMASTPMYQGPVPAAAPVGAAPFALTDTFKLHSLPGAQKTIYLDFDGYVTENTQWNIDFTTNTIVTPAFDTDGNQSEFSDAELTEIQHIWQRVAEDYIPFNVDVTTEFVSESLLIRDTPVDPVYGMRAAIGGDFTIIPGLGAAGGVAYLDGFGEQNTSPAFVFAVAQGNDESIVAETISHEVGHTLGLSHDGDAANAYYPGHGFGATSWGPIMGAPFFISVTQWSRGEYPGANNVEDDLAIITSMTNQNQFGYRPDDFGSSLATASPFQFTSGGIGFVDGIIERNTDTDWFAIDLPDGDASFDANPIERGANLDILLDLYDSSGNKLASSNPVDALNASITTTLGGGRYYVRIQGTGKAPTLLDPGYSDYGSLGQYHIQVEVDPSSHVRGSAYLDGDADGARQAQDSPAVGFVVYLDDNLNGKHDASESFSVTDGAGGFDIATVGGPRNVRMVLPPGYFPTDPPSGVVQVVVPPNGGLVDGVVLGISGAKGEVRGRKWLDVAGDGIIQPEQGDRPMEGQYIFVDLNNDGRAGVGEPGALSNANGDYVITNVPIGIRTIREVSTPGFAVSVPQTNGGAYLVNMTPGAVIIGRDFFNSPAHDYGDAPDSYRTLLASGGPVHGYVKGYGLGALLDADADGKPTTFASGDDNTFSDDEDGVVFKNTPSPGKPFNFTVSVQVPAFTPAGNLNAWMDFNRDGDFADAGEKIIGGRVLATGTYDFSVNVPAGAVLGRTYLRFRYGVESNIGFGGAAVKGEVEDYSVLVLGATPVANNDTATVEEFSKNNPIDVLANDLRSINGSISIDAGSFPAQSKLGGKLTLDDNGTPNNPSDDFVRYDAAPAPKGTKPYVDSFVYTITDGTNTDDAIVWIRVNRVSTPPKAIDDTVTAKSSGTTTFFPTQYLGNDIPGTDHGLPYTKVGLFSFTTAVKDESGATIGTVSRDTNGTPDDQTDDRLIFAPAAGAAGKTGQFTYTARNPDPTNPPVGSTATVTVQVHGYNAVDNNDIVKLSIDVRNTAADGGVAGTSPTQLVQGQKYWVGIFADDLRQQFLDKNGKVANGALSVYLDLLFDDRYVSPVRAGATTRNPAGLNIRYGWKYNSGSTGFSGSTTTGMINELGVTSGEQVIGEQNLPVMFVQFVANKLTPGTTGIALWKTDPADERNVIDPSFTHDVTVVNRADPTQLQDLDISNIAYFYSRSFRIVAPAAPAASATLASTTTTTTSKTPTAPQQPLYTTSTTAKTSSALDAAIAAMFSEEDPYKKK